MERAEMAMKKDTIVVWYQKALCVHGCHIYTFTRKYGNQQLAKLLCAWQSYWTFATRSVVVVCTFSEERWKHSLHCDYYVSSIFCLANCLACLNFRGINFRRFV